MADRSGKKAREERGRDVPDPISGMTEAEITRDIDRILARLECMGEDAKVKDALLMDRVRGHG